MAINYPQTGGTFPATQAPANSLENFNFNYTGTPAPFADRNYNEMVGSSLEYFLDPNSDYIRNARQRGIEFAAQRGGINSSIAAGAAERSALEAATPLAQSAVAAQLNQEQAQLQDWADKQGFNRELSTLPFKNSINMLNAVSNYALQDPQLYTPSVVSGFSNFFTQNMNDIISQYFKSAV